MCSRALIPGLLPYNNRRNSRKFHKRTYVEAVPDNKKATKFGLAIFTGRPFSVYQPEYIDETGEKGFCFTNAIVLRCVIQLTCS